MSVTTKSHLAEDHSCEQQGNLDGIGNLGEDFGERNHQDEAKADRRLGCVRNFAIRESIKSKEEVQVKDQRMQAKLIKIKEKQRKGPSVVNQARQAAKQQRLCVPGMNCINEKMRRHALASGFRFVLRDCVAGVPVKLLPIVLLELVLVDSRVGWIKPYLPLWTQLQISKDMKGLFKMPGSGHRKVARLFN
jgi:hypothetical protein